MAGNEEAEDTRPLIQRAEENLRVKLLEEIAKYRSRYEERGVPPPARVIERVSNLETRVAAINRRYGPADG